MASFPGTSCSQVLGSGGRKERKLGRQVEDKKYGEDRGRQREKGRHGKKKDGWGTVWITSLDVEKTKNRPGDFFTLFCRGKKKKRINPLLSSASFSSL